MKLTFIDPANHNLSKTDNYFCWRLTCIIRKVYFWEKDKILHDKYPGVFGKIKVRYL